MISPFIIIPLVISFILFCIGIYNFFKDDPKDEKKKTLYIVLIILGSPGIVSAFILFLYIAQKVPVMLLEEAVVL